MLIDRELTLLKALRKCRTAIRKMQAECNQYDEGFQIGKLALREVNSTLRDFKKPVARPLPRDADSGTAIAC